MRVFHTSTNCRRDRFTTYRGYPTHVLVCEHKEQSKKACAFFNTTYCASYFLFHAHTWHARKLMCVIFRALYKIKIIIFPRRKFYACGVLFKTKMEILCLNSSSINRKRKGWLKPPFYARFKRCKVLLTNMFKNTPNEKI